MFARHRLAARTLLIATARHTSTPSFRLSTATSLTARSISHTRPQSSPRCCAPSLVSPYLYSSCSRQTNQIGSGPSELRRQLKLPTRRPRRISKRFWRLILGLRITYIGQPRVADKDRDSEGTGMPKAAFYAVAAGRKPGVYTTWSEAEAQVKGYAGARYKKFPTESQANEFIESESSPASMRAAAASYASSTSPASSSSGAAGPSRETHTRAESPPTNAPQSTLPPRLQGLARDGYMFTKGPVHYLVVHTDGSALGNGKVGSRAGAGVFWGSSGDAASRNLSERVPGLPQTNNRGELLAVIRALENCPFPDIPLEVRCDSQYTISCMTTWLPKWLRTNFRTSSTPYARNNGSFSSSTNEPTKQVSNVDMVKHLLVLLRRRGKNGRVKFKYVPAHTGIEGNEAADRLAKMGSMSPEVPNRIDWLDPDKEKIEPQHAGKGTEDVKNGLKDIEVGITDIEVEIDENWLMSPEEWANLEDELNGAESL